MRKVHFQAIAIACFALLFLQGPASGTPPTRTIDANVINTPDVEVINDSTNPVPVTVIKEQRRPFQTYVSCRPTGSYWYGCDTLSTPEDARLVIEQVGISFVPNDPTTEVLQFRKEANSPRSMPMRAVTYGSKC